MEAIAVTVGSDVSTDRLDVHVRVDGDLGLRAHGVDGDEGSGEFELLEQQRNCTDFVGLLGDGPHSVSSRISGKGEATCHD